MFNFPSFSLPPAVAGIVAAARRLTLGFSYQVTINGLRTPDDAVELARLSAAAHGTVCAVISCGGSGAPGVSTTVEALNRSMLAASMSSNATVFNITWQARAVIRSSLLSAASELLLSPDDVATFTEALEFARDAVASASRSLETLFAGDISTNGIHPMLDCASALLANASMAALLGCAPPLTRRLQGAASGSNSSSEGSSNSSTPSSVPLSFLPALQVLSTAVGAAHWSVSGNLSLTWSRVSNYSTLGSTIWEGPNGTALASPTSTPNGTALASPTSTPNGTFVTLPTSAPPSVTPAAPRDNTLSQAATQPGASPDDATGPAVGAVLAVLVLLAMLLLLIHRRRSATKKAMTSIAPPTPLHYAKVPRSTMANVLAGHRFDLKTTPPAVTTPISTSEPFFFDNPLSQPSSFNREVKPVKPGKTGADELSSTDLAPSIVTVPSTVASETPCAALSTDAVVVAAKAPAMAEEIPAEETLAEEQAEESPAKDILTKGTHLSPPPDELVTQLEATTSVVATESGRQLLLPTAAARRQYARLLSAQGKFTHAKQQQLASNALRVFRRSEEMTQAEAGLMILRSWRARKLARVARHFAKVAVYDK